MLYPVLSELISQHRLPESLVKQYDFWLGNLYDGVSNKFTVGKVSKDLMTEYRIAKVLVDLSIEKGLLKRMYGVMCPNCKTMIKILEEYELRSYLKDTHSCYGCTNEFIKFELKDICVVYRRIKEPEMNFISQADVNAFFNVDFRSEQETMEEWVKENSTDRFFYNKVDVKQQLGESCSNIAKCNGDIETLFEFVVELFDKLDVLTIADIYEDKHEIIYEVLDQAIPSNLLSIFGSCIRVDVIEETSNVEKIISNQDVCWNGEKIGIYFLFRYKEIETCENNVIISQYHFNKKIVILFTIDELNSIINNEENLWSIIGEKIELIKKTLI